jgi:hypothetical protein
LRMAIHIKKEIHIPQRKNKNNFKLTSNWCSLIWTYWFGDLSILIFRKCFCEYICHIVVYIDRSRWLFGVCSDLNCYDSRCQCS